jgi:hypothetical protein
MVVGLRSAHAVATAAQEQEVAERGAGSEDMTRGEREMEASMKHQADLCAGHDAGQLHDPFPLR